MPKFTDKKSLSYQDVNLIAQPGIVASRSSIPIEGWRIVIAAMSSLICKELLIAVKNLPKELQPTIHIPRDSYAEYHLRLAKELGLEHIFVGIGLDTPNLEKLAKELGYNTLLIDIANGGIPQLPEKISKLKQDGFKVIAGSVSNMVTGHKLIKAGVDILRSGVGTGNACSTKEQTGFTRGNLSEVLALEKYISYNNKLSHEILADGGFRTSGDVTKAFLAGADYVMSGRLFVDAKEARLRMDGSHLYFGMASTVGKECFANDRKFIEGKVELQSKDKIRPLETILNEIWDGIRSGVSYSGYATLTDAIGNGVFEIKHE